MDKVELAKLLELAEHHFQLNDYQNSKTILRKITTSDPRNSRANELLAYIYGNQGNADCSYAFLELACKDENCSPESLYYLGVAKLDRARFKDAIYILNKAINKAGEFFEALHDLATAHAFLGETQISLRCYQKCLNLRKDSPELHFNLARIYDELKHFDDALVHYDQALNLKPDYI